MKKMIIAAAAASLFATAAYAAVNYDPETGGTVGKGDVQLALNMNNNQLQAQLSTIVFTYDDTADFDVPCKKETKSQINRNTFQRSSDISATVTYDTKGKKQVTGFILDPVDLSGADSDNVSCPGGWEADGAPVLVSSSDGGLKVNGVALPNTPVL